MFGCCKYRCSLIPRALQFLRSILVLILSSFHRRLTVEEQCYEECIKSTACCPEDKEASLFLKTAWMMQQSGGKICAEIGLEKNFAQTENEAEIIVRGTRFPRRPNFTVWAAQGRRKHLKLGARCFKSISFLKLKNIPEKKQGTYLFIAESWGHMPPVPPRFLRL